LEVHEQDNHPYFTEVSMSPMDGAHWMPRVIVALAAAIDKKDAREFNLELADGTTVLRVTGGREPGHQVNSARPLPAS